MLNITCGSWSSLNFFLALHTRASVMCITSVQCVLTSSLRLARVLPSSCVFLPILMTELLDRAHSSLIDLRSDPLARLFVCSLSPWAQVALDNSHLPFPCVLSWHVQDGKKIINKSDRKWICMTDNLSALWNRASPRQTLVARRTSNWNDISPRQQPVELRGTSVQEWGRITLYNSCTVWPACPVWLNYLYAFPSLNSPIRKGKGRRRSSVSRIGLNMRWDCE